MKKKIHYMPAWAIFTTCGFWPIKSFGDKFTNRRKRVTCGNCKRTKLFRKER